MTGKDVWRWLLNKFDNDVIYQIYEKQKVVCKGFRTNTIQDISSNRTRLINNILNKDNYKKLVLWSVDNPPIVLDGVSLVDKELNELADIATEKGVTNVLIQLFCDYQERRAIQFFAYLQDEQSVLLNIPSQSLGISGDESTQSIKEESEPIETSQNTNENETTNSDAKKIKKLEKKANNLTEELKRRDIIHKSKVEDLERNQLQTLVKLNEKNQLYSILLREKDTLNREYQEEKSRWEKELSIYQDTIARLEDEVSKLKEKIDKDTCSNAVIEDVNIKRKILVIGKPAYTTHFRSERIEFSFVEGNDVHDYMFTENFDAYWVLSYELSNRDQFLLKANDSYAQLDGNKVNICKDFNEVKKQMNFYSKVEERIM